MPPSPSDLLLERLYHLYPQLSFKQPLLPELDLFRLWLPNPEKFQTRKKIENCLQPLMQSQGKRLISNKSQFAFGEQGS
jgi:hypothetical protein